MTSGESSATDTADFAANRRRTTATDASAARATVMVLDTLATNTLVFNAWINSGLDRNWRYQRSVNPESGKDTTMLLLNEKITRMTRGAYRNSTSAPKNTRSPHRPFLEAAMSITPPPRS